MLRIDGDRDTAWDRVCETFDAMDRVKWYVEMGDRIAAKCSAFANNKYYLVAEFPEEDRQEETTVIALRYDRTVNHVSQDTTPSQVRNRFVETYAERFGELDVLHPIEPIGRLDATARAYREQSSTSDPSEFQGEPDQEKIDEMADRYERRDKIVRWAVVIAAIAGPPFAVFLLL